MKLGSKESSSLEGVIRKELVSHPDERGFFREIIRKSDPFFQGADFGQWSHSRMTKNVVKAWHFHHRQTDWWYVGAGTVEAIFIDNREESETYRKKSIHLLSGDNAGLGAQACIRIPPGVLHGLRVLSESADLFYITSDVYNPEDEGRIPFDSPEIAHHFPADSITTARDRVLFMPPFSRLSSRY